MGCERIEVLRHFMHPKGVMQRFTQWYNGKHKRSGTLWERRFKSVVVEDGLAARTMAAYIDLNPVRAGMVSDPAEYRWSGYGEAVGGGTKGDGKRAREGLVRAWMAHKGWDGDAKLWDVKGVRACSTNQLVRNNPFFPALRSSHELPQRPSPPKQFLSNNCWPRKSCEK